MLREEGGTRSQFISKQGSSSNPLISVITVVFNGGNELEETILSVINQTYALVEYIIIDGGSTDNTLEILKKYDSRIDYWVSEKDNGIYDAMNKGITLASGQFLNFMNCGDRFFSNQVLFDIFQHYPSNSISSKILFGDWEVRYPSGKSRLVTSGEVRDLWKGSQFCHQSVFVESGYHKENLYNSEHPMVADFEFFFSAFKKGISFEKINKVVSSILAGGISDIERFEVVKSWWSIAGRGIRNDTYYSARLFREYMVFLVKKIIR